jgi:hypothetical protein
VGATWDHGIRASKLTRVLADINQKPRTLCWSWAMSQSSTTSGWAQLPTQTVCTARCRQSIEIGAEPSAHQHMMGLQGYDGSLPLPCGQVCAQQEGPWRMRDQRQCVGREVDGAGKECTTSSNHEPCACRGTAPPAGHRAPPCERPMPQVWSYTYTPHPCEQWMLDRGQIEGSCCMHIAPPAGTEGGSWRFPARPPPFLCLAPLPARGICFAEWVRRSC